MMGKERYEKSVGSTNYFGKSKGNNKLDTDNTVAGSKNDNYFFLQKNSCSFFQCKS